MSGDGHGRTTRLDTIRPERVRWLWPGRMALRKITVLDGDPGLGKSTMMLDIAARVTRRGLMPDGPGGEVFGDGVVILTAEDGLADTVRPRLDAAGADCSRVVALEAVSDGEGRERLPTVADVGAIDSAIAAVKASLVIIDPLMAYLGTDTNAHRDQDVRSALALLAELAEHTGVAVVAIRHLNKTAGRNPIYRGGGSIGIIGAARSGLLVARDPDDTDGPRRILASTKANLAAPPPSLAYTLAPDGEGRLRVEWAGESRHTARALLAEPEDDGERSKLDEASSLLVEMLPARVVDIRREARAAGISERTLERAKTRLGARAQRHGGAAGEGWWEWHLPNTNGRGGLRENPAQQHNSAKAAKVDEIGATCPPWCGIERLCDACRPGAGEAER